MPTDDDDDVILIGKGGRVSSLTPTQLLQIMPKCLAADVHADPLERAMQFAAINTPVRRAAFLAQVAHESGQLRYAEEIADGSAYEGRADLGNNEPGDGRRYKGRGWLQITGKSNYDRCGKALKLDLVASPQLLTTPENAARSAAWFWMTRQLNELADLDQFGLITRRINGGFTGLDDRIKHWLRARRVLGL
ncbi:MAG TPA: glycoside hydrolase family 19 protein [Aquabacterium sp.]|nr:glycoside hydrolase family 19 protein [Aquabacterium sp.]